MHQLRCFGMMDTIHIRKLGYPIRHSHGDFLKRYRMLLDRTLRDPKTVRCVFILSHRTPIEILPVYCLFL